MYPTQRGIEALEKLRREAELEQARMVHESKGLDETPVRPDDPTGRDESC